MQEAETVMAVGVAEAARRLGVSQRTLATLLAKGELSSRRIGRRRVIPVDALKKFLNEDEGKITETTNKG